MNPAFSAFIESTAITESKDHANLRQGHFISRNKAHYRPNKSLFYADSKNMNLSIDKMYPKQVNNDICFTYE